MHRAGVHGVEQSRRPIAVQLERIHPGTDLTAKQHADPFQAAQGLQVNEAAANGQVARFDEPDRQLARQKDVLEPQRVGMSAGQHADAALATRASACSASPAASMNGRNGSIC